MKKCRICKTPKQLSEFSKDSKGKYGVTARCKTCDKAYREELKAIKKCLKVTEPVKITTEQAIEATQKSLVGSNTKKTIKQRGKDLNRHSVDASKVFKVKITGEHTDIFKYLKGKNYRIFSNSQGKTHFVMQVPHISVEFTSSEDLINQLIVKG